MTQIISGHSLGLLDGSLSNLLRNDTTNNGSLANGVSGFVNVGNGNMVWQERDAYLPSLGPDFDLVRTYNSRGVIPGTFDGWSFSTAVKLETHNDFLLDGKTQRNFTVTYGDQSMLHFDFDAAGNRWVATDGGGAYEVLTELSGGGTSGPAFLVVRADQSQYRFDKAGFLLSITDPNGVAMTFTYQGGKLRTVQDDTGHTITFVQSGNQLDRITKTSATDSTVTTLVQFTYVNSQLVAVTDRSGHVTRYTYDGNGMLVGVSLPFQQTVGGVAQTYEQRNYAFGYERYYWDDKPHYITPFDQGYSYILRSMTDAMGGVTTFDYDFRFATTIDPADRDINYKPGGSREFQGGSARVVDALGNARATSNAAEYVAWRTANGFYATYSSTVPQAQVDAIRNAQSIVYTFDANSQITQVVDPLGQRTTYVYDARGNLVSTTDRNGWLAVSRDDQLPGDGYWRRQRVELGFADQPISWFTAQPTWATAGGLQSQILARYTTTSTWDARGNRTSVTDGAGNRTSSTYTAFNKVASSTSPMGNALAELDTAELRAKRVELGFAGSGPAPGQLSGLSTAQRDALRALYTTTYTYDAKQNLVRRTDPGGDVTNYQYDANGNLVRRDVIVPAVNGNAAQTQTTLYAYDPFGNVRQVTDGEGVVSLQSFDTFGNLLAATDGRGGVTTYTYDADNRLLSARTPEGRTTLNAYDAVGNRISITDFAGKTVTQVFDRNNMLVSTIDPALSDPARTRTTTFQYDILGNRTRVADAEGRITLYRWDAARRMVQVTTPSVTRADGSTGSYASSWAYDGEGNVVTQVDNNGNTTQTQYGSIGLVRRITDALGNVTEYLYDANRQQIQVLIGAQLPLGQRRILRYSYDEEDQRIASTDAIGGVRRTLYDAVGNVVAETDENGNQTRFAFDRNNRLVRETQPDGTTVQHVFDGNGNEITTTDENGNVTRTFFDRDDRRVMLTDGNGINTVWEYDTRSNTTRVLIGAAATWNAATARVVLGDLNQAQVESFAYDEFGDLVSQTDAVGWALANSDSAAAQQMRLEAGKSQLAAGLSAADRTSFLNQYTRRYGYDRVGNRTTETDALGRVTAWSWDGMDRLVSRTDAAGTALARTTGFRWDGNDNQVRTVDAAGRVATYRFDAADQIVETTDALGVRTTFSYDNVGNKLSETRAAGSPDARTTSWSYDLADRRLTETDPEGHTTAYQYDPVGNRTRVVDGRGNATQYVYDSRNRNVRIVDPLGGQTQMVYDGVGNQVRLIDPRGGIRETAFDAGNRTVQLTDAEGRITRYAYDVRDNVVTMTTAAGRPESQVTSFVYDAENNLRAVTDGEGRTSRLGYDAVYNETRSVDGNGNVTTTAYDALNRRILVTDPLGGQTAYTYDSVDNQLTETDALGRVRRWSYDANDRTTSMTDALGVRTDYAYDTVGNRIRVTEAANRPGQERTTQFFLDKDDRLVRQIDPLGGQTRYEYDANDNVTRITDPNGNPTAYAYDANNRVTTVTDPLGGVTTYAYDANGNRTRVTDPRGASTTFYFNRNNEVTRIVDPLGFVTARSHDGNGNLVAETQFANAVAVPADANAPPADPAASAGGDRTRRWAYDRVNRVVQQTSAEGFVSRMAYDAVGNKVSDTDALNRTTTYLYDANDRLVRTTNPGGGVSTRTYDAVGNLLSETDELNRTTRYTYDLENRLLTTIDAAGGVREATWDAVGNRLTDQDELGRVTRFAYDANDRLVARTDPAGGIARYTYDAAGNRTTQVDELGRTTQFFYDAKNQLVRQVDPLNGEKRFAYDGAGNRTAETDELGRTRTSTYDLDGRVTAQTDPLGNTRTFGYDAVDNLVAETDERGFTTRYGYDRDNRQTSRTDPLGATRTMAYDAVGNQIGMTDENGGTTTWQFDVLDRLVRQTNPLGPSNVRTWTYDAVGNQLTETDENGNTTAFQYDALDRVVQRTDALGGRRSFGYDAVGNRLSDTNERGKTTTFGYDALDRQTTVTDPLGGVRSTTYDAVGNRTSETDERGKTTTSAYDANDRQTSQTDPQGGVRTQTYDAAGNVVTQTDENGQVVSFAYDANNRVTSQTNPIGQVLTSWDPAGNKASETDENGNTTVFSYDGNDRLTRKTDPLNGTYRFGYDAKGNKTSETDENGNGATYRYDASDRVVEVTDGEGYRTTIVYDAAGNAVQRRQQLDLVDPGKVAVTTEKFDALDRSTDTLTADGRLIRYEYDATGNVTKQTEHDQVYTIPTTPVVPAPASGDNGRGTTFTYDDNGRQTSKTTPEGVVTTYQYDAAGNRTKETDGAGSGNEKSKDFGYDNNGRVTTETDALGIVTRWVLDARGNPLEKHEAFGTAQVRVTKWEYDGNNRVRKETDAEGYVTTYGYDAAGNMTSRVRAGRTETFEYDKNRRLTVEVNGAGERTEYRYDGAGNRTEIRAGIVGNAPPLRVLGFEYDENNNLTAEIDGRGIRTEHRYDGAGNRVETVQNAGAADPSMRRTTTFAYDGDNRLVRVTNPEGGVTRYAYDTQGNQTEVVMPTGAVNRNTFDGNGRITVNIVDADGAKGGIKTVNTYDVHGNVTSTTVSFGDGSDARTTRYAYDALNRQTSVTDGEGFTTTFAYDAFGNQTTIVTGQYLVASNDPAYDAAKAARARPSRIDFSYDRLDRLVDSRQTTNNATGAADTVRATYDAFGNRLTQTTGFGTAAARTQSFAYDGANRIVRRDSQAGGVVILQYDAVGNQVRKLQLQSGIENTPGAVWIDQRFEYDGNGQLTAELNVLDATTTVRTNRILDAFGNEIETVVAAGTADERRTTFRYDRNNELIEKVEGAGTGYERRTQYQLDAAGRVIRETDALGRATRLYYDGAGRHVGTLDPMGYFTQFFRDSADNVVESRVYLQRYIDAAPGQYDLVAPTPAAGDAPQTIVHTFDRVGNRTEQVQADGTRFTYVYDANRKLTSQTAYGSSDPARVAATARNAPQTLQWRYDDALRMVSFTSLDGTVETYEYDSSNNKVSESAANPNALVGGNADPVRTTRFVYDGENRLVEQRFDENGLNLVDRLEYDKAGNVVRKTDRNGNATLSTYDRFNRVLTVTDPVGGVTTFAYDLVGNQVSILNSRGFRTELSYDKLDQLLVQRLPAVNAYTIDGGLETDVRPETRLVYDRAGNVIQEVDENGGRTTRWFDANNNVIAEVSPDGALRTATFDANNNTLTTTLFMQKLPVSVHDTPAVQPSPPSGDQRTTTYAYDAGNRVVQATLPQVEVTTLSNFATGDDPSSSSSVVSLSKTNTYDRFGNLVTSLDEAGRRVWGWYDALGRQVAAVDAAGYLTESFYDSQGNIVRQLKYVTALDTSALSPATRPVAPGGDVAQVDRVYDAANRLVSETSGGVKTGTSNVSSTFERITTTFGYDANGNRIRRTLAAGTPDEQVEHYWFDAANRQIAVVNPARTLHTFAYDVGGNQTEQKRYFNAVPTGVALASASYAQLLAAVGADAARDQTTSFAFDALNRLLTQTQVVSGGAPGSAYTSITSSTDYDRIGNATRKTDGDGLQTRVAYDSLGNAIRTITPNNVTSFVEYNTAGEKIRAWTGVLGANGAQAATGVSAAIDDQLRFSWTQSGNSDLQSYVVYDTQPRADSALTSARPENVYTQRSGTRGTGSVSIGVPLDGFAAGQTVYFRVVTTDTAGSQAWTEERTLVVPARPTALASSDIAGANIRLTVTFNGAVSAPQLLYGAASASSTAGFTLVGGNTYRVDIPEADAGFYALRWTYASETYTTTATPFSATGPHVYDPVTKEASWTLPRPLADLQTNPGEAVLIDGVRLANGYTFNGEVHFKPNLATAANGTRTLDVLYGNDVTTGHSASVSNVDNRPVSFTQVVNRDSDNNITSIVRTYSYSHDYRTNVSVALNAAETATVGAGGMRVSWRTAGGGTQFTGDAALGQNVNTFSASLALAPQTYDLKVYYFNSAGQEVIVEWRRVTVAATALPGNVVVTDNTSPFDFGGLTLPTAQPTTTATIDFGASASLIVLARETGGSITRTGGASTPSISITAGRYSGPLGASVSSFALGVGSTAGSQGGQLASNGLVAASYFTEIEYNALGQKVASNEEEGLWRRYGLDAAGNRVVTRLFGTKAAEVAFDGGDTSMAPITTYAVFDVRDNEIKRFGAEVAVVNDAAARPVTRMTYDYANQMTSRLEPGDTLAQTWTFDLAGNRIADSNALGQTTSYRYNRLGDVIAVTDARGNTKRREYDAAGRMTAELDALGSSTTYEYDSFGRVTRRIDPVGNVTRYAYDQRDRLVQVTDALGQNSSWAYDRRDNRVRETGFDGDVRTNVYDSMSRIISQSSTSAIVSGGAQQTITSFFFYDAYGNRVAEIDPGFRLRYMTYGLTGRITSISDEGFRLTTFEYDRFGRQVAERGERGASDKAILRTYNAAGWLTSVEDRGGDTGQPKTTYSYDIAGNRVAENVSVPFLLGSRITVRSMNLTYDAIGRMTSWSDAISGLNLSYEWDAAGNRTRVYTNGLSGDQKRDNLYTYDAADRVTSVQSWNQAVGARLFSESYVYNAAGQRVQQSAGGNNFSYSYDALGRVTQAVETANPARVRATWSYDALGNVLSYLEYKTDGTKLREQTNTYFENGLTKTSFTETTEDVNDDDKKKKQTSTNEYDVSGRLVKQTLFDATDSDNEITYTYGFLYTPDGRTLSISASGSNDATGSSSSTYNANDQLTQLDKGKGDDREGNELLTFSYDNDGKIITRLHDDGEDDTTTSPFTRFVYANGEPVGETGSNNSGGTVTLLDENGLSGDKQDMQYRALQVIDKDHPGASTSTYNVRLGDSLQTIAASVYGNPSLWFLIADANGLKGDASLKAGQVLQVPTSVEPGRLNSDSHVLYRESDIIGSKLPNLKTPESSSDNCALIGAIIALIFVAILAVVVTIVTVGIAAPAAVAALVGVGGAVGAAAATTLGTVIITVAVSAVIGAVVAAAASAISQGILIGAGLQKEWDWKQFAADVVVGFISGAVSGLGQALQVVKIASTVAKVANVAAQAALEAAGETARQAIANDGVIDNPWTILAAGVGGAFGALASRAVRTESQVRGKVGSLLTRQIKEVSEELGTGTTRVVGKTQKVVVQSINPAELAKFGEGASVFKGATTKLVKTVDSAGTPILKQVERTATAAGKAQTILKLKDTKLVRIGNEVREVARVSKQFTVAQRIGRRLSGFAGSALDAVKSIPSAIAGAGKAIVGAAGNAVKAAASGIREFGKSAAAAIRAVPDKLADAWESAKFVARIVGRAAKTKITNFVRSSATAVRSVGRDIAELPARIAQSASEAWAATKTAMKTARDALRDIAQTAGSAIKSLPGKIKQGASDIAQSFREWRKSGTVTKGQLTKTVRSFEDGPTGRVEKFSQVYRTSYLKKGYVTLAKTGNNLPAGSKLVRVGDEVQVWRRVSDQYSTGQRLSRWLSKNSVLKVFSTSEFKVDQTVLKGTTTKVVRTGFGRQFNEATQTFDEVARYASKPRLVSQGLDKTTQFVNAVKTAASATKQAFANAGRAAAEAVKAIGNGVVSGARAAGRGIAGGFTKAVDAAGDAITKMRAWFANDFPSLARKTLLTLGDKISNAHPFTKWRMVGLGVTIGKSVATGALRDYKDDRAGGPISTLVTAGKGIALTALKRPREALNDWLLNESRNGFAKDDESLQLKISSIRQGLYGLERSRGWWPFQWVATGTNVFSRVQSPIDLDFNQTYEQRLRTSRLSAGETSSFEPQSVFDFAADLDGRISDRKIPLLSLSNLPPLPRPALGG